MSFYKILDQQEFSKGNFKIVPIRYTDRFEIMKWRNEQIYHLRQPEPLTEEHQELYFTNTIAQLFEQSSPNQLLFSFLKDDECIGYGGVVHINWIDKNAEISFIMNTELEKEFFELNWSIFIELIEQVAFSALKFHKVFTYAFDIRPHLYSILEEAGYEKEAILKEHCMFDGEYKDVVIHSKINKH